VEEVEMDFDDAMMEMVLYPWLDDPSLNEEYDGDYYPEPDNFEDDGDALASAGMGTDEDYFCFGGDE
jgi:hypothetical protein